MKSKQLFVANWKMQLTYNESVAFCTDNKTAIAQLAHAHHELVLCPSFPALPTMKQILKDSDVHIGAQNVSRHPSGAYTGEVSAASLAEVGCTYCIIGHSERRRYYDEDNIDIEHKCKELLKHNITPIICIGETKEQQEQDKTFCTLEEQLAPNLQAIVNHNHTVPSFVIAYEPVWAIGTGTTPDIATLTDIFSWLHNQCATQTDVSFRLLYGGSATDRNAAELLAIEHVDGLLIGGASTTFSSLQALVQSCKHFAP